MKRTFLIIFICLICGFHITAQKNEHLIQLSGVVRNEYLETLQFVHILIVNKKKGTISDNKGRFNFIVEPEDTVVYTYMGYKQEGLIIPDTLSEYFYIRDVIMETDTFEIKEVIILPWKTYEEFKQAFINLDLPDDDMQRAYKNMALIRAQILYADMAPDPSINYKYLIKEQYNELYTRGQTPYYSIFNPMRWAEFIRYLEEGKFKNPNKKKKEND